MWSLPSVFSYLCVLLLPAPQVLDDVTEYESTSEGRRVTRLDQILLNGNNITMLVPGGEGPEGPQGS